ncbi:3-phosphoshikimate 1-carboxyvinyltransferase [Candidatus Carsonella ruddii]|uniref:3-phosphoshikimate 1-carboxyvinyltransferase n=1 Tax=Carsonella ruddii TaxID=114186 RepID=UPI003D9A84F5
MKSYFKIKKINIKKKKVFSGDKSISHRCIIFSLIKNCLIEIENLLESFDIISTINLCKNLGIYIYGPINSYLIVSSYKKKNIFNKINYIGNSGTTIRISLSLLISNNIILGDKSLNKRTMYRIIKPLTLLGYIIQCKKNFFTPIIIFKKNNFGLKYNLVNASSQIKSCLILSSINSFLNIYIKENKKTRDHSERFLYFLIKKKNDFLIKIKNDFSSISFIISLFLIKKKNFIVNCNFNKLRIGFFDYLISIGFIFYIIKKKILNNEHLIKILIFNKKIKNNIIYSETISKMIDEIPILLSFIINYKNIIKIYGLEELKFKESNRFINMYKNLIFLGIKTKIKNNYLILKGGKFHKNFIFSHTDHRLFMSFYIINIKNLKISNPENILSSFPNFFKYFKNNKNKLYVFN